MEKGQRFAAMLGIRPPTVGGVGALLILNGKLTQIKDVRFLRLDSQYLCLLRQSWTLVQRFEESEIKEKATLESGTQAFHRLIHPWR